jgi:hypothetical protein
VKPLAADWDTATPPNGLVHFKKRSPPGGGLHP